MPLLSEIALNPEVLSQIHFDRASDRLSLWVLKNDRPRLATPEETMRQLVVASLIVKYGYPPERIACEVVIQIGINRPRADVVIFDERRSIETIIEVKAYNTSHAIGQISSYMRASGAKYGAVVLSKSTNYLEQTSDGRILSGSNIPVFGKFCFTSTPEASEELDSLAPLDSLKRVSKSEVLLIYKGESIRMKNVDAVSLIKVKRAFLAEGMVLSIDQAESVSWTERISHAIDTCNIPDCNSDYPLSEDDRMFLETLRGLPIVGVPFLSLTDAILLYTKCIDEAQRELISTRLQVSGVRVQEDVVLFANQHAGTIFTNTPYQGIWKTNLKSLAIKTAMIGRVARFSGKLSRCVCLPRKLLLEQRTLSTSKKYNLV